MDEFLTIEFLGNSLQDYTWFISSILIGLIFKKLIANYLSNLLFRLIKRGNTDLGTKKFDELLTQPIGFFIMLIIIYLGSSHIQYPPEWNLVSENKIGLKMLISKGFSLVFIFSLLRILIRLIDFSGFILMKKAELTESKMDDQLIPFII